MSLMMMMNGRLNSLLDDMEEEIKEDQMNVKHLNSGHSKDKIKS